MFLNSDNFFSVKLNRIIKDSFDNTVLIMVFINFENTNK